MQHEVVGVGRRVRQFTMTGPRFSAAMRAASAFPAAVEDAPTATARAARIFEEGTEQ